VAGAGVDRRLLPVWEARTQPPPASAGLGQSSLGAHQPAPVGSAVLPIHQAAAELNAIGQPRAGGAPFELQDPAGLVV